MKQISELRQDMVSGDWVVVATGRARRPNEYIGHRREPPQPKAKCPFEPLADSSFFIYDEKGKRYQLSAKDRPYLEAHWRVQVIPNKYPAFGYGECAVQRTIGPYQWQDGVGFHDVVVTRDHTRSLGRLDPTQVRTVLLAYRDRYLDLIGQGCVEYISIFHNHGRDAGASITHPHSQIIATPVIPPDISRSLKGSAAYYTLHRSCVHCTMLEYELQVKKRLVYVNSNFVVLCPYASRQAFEVRIFPRHHTGRFEESTESEIEAAADALRQALARLYQGLRDPAYNFFIHTSPVSQRATPDHYHWHIEIIPKMAIWAGFEIGTGIEISTIAPESAARFLRSFRS